MCKTVLIFFIFFSQMSAQNPDVKQPVVEAMKDFSVMIGKWQGNGWRIDSNRERDSSSVNEELQWKLDSTAIFIQGIGKKDNGLVVHNAMAILFYDPFQKQYKMNSHLSSGLFTQATFEVKKPNALYVWGFETAGGKVRYTISFNSSSEWHEVGEFSRDGENWFQTFEMNLNKVE